MTQEEKRDWKEQMAEITDRARHRKRRDSRRAIVKTTETGESDDEGDREYYDQIARQNAEKVRDDW